MFCGYWWHGLLMVQARGAQRANGVGPVQDCPEGVKALVGRCTASDPNDRPTAEPLVEQLRALSASGSSHAMENGHTDARPVNGHMDLPAPEAWPATTADAQTQDLPVDPISTAALRLQGSWAGHAGSAGSTSQRDRDSD